MLEELVAFVHAELTARADPARAAAMAAYMKTPMPFYGVGATERRAIGRAAQQRFALSGRADYEAAVTALWARPHREEKYLAIQLARARRFIHLDSLPLYRQMIVEGAWWDLVDEIASHILGALLARDAAGLWPHLDAWIDDPDLWIRRAALLAQLKRKQATDATRLFDWCRRRMGEKEFFIRKAVGWALREYGKTAPDAVAGFLRAERAHLSGLSFREGSRILAKQGYSFD